MGETDGEKRANFRHLACGIDRPLDAGTVHCDFFAEFMRKKDVKDKHRALEWARRFARGNVFQHSDAENRQILLDIMVDGPGDGTASHLDKDDVKQFCKRRGCLKL